MGRESRRHPKPHRRFDRASLMIHSYAIAADEKRLLVRALAADVATLEMGEQRLAYRQLASVAVSLGRAKNSSRAKAHRRRRESYAKRTRIQFGLASLKGHL